MELSHPIHRHAPDLLSASATEDQRERGPLTALLGADGADALAAVVEVRRVFQAGGDGPALGEEGVEFGE